MEELFSLQDLYQDQIQNNRIRTRFLNRVDIPIWLPFFENDEHFKFLTERNSLTNHQLSENWIQRQMNRYHEGTFGLQAVIDKKSKLVVAHCGLLLQKVNNQLEIEVGYHVLPKFCGQNYATEAAKLFIDFAFENGLCSSLISMIDPDNIKSIRFAEKNGFKFEQTIEDSIGYRPKINIYRLSN
jgi:RimJ/RimL family protein N-acetyltransferase